MDDNPVCPACRHVTRKHGPGGCEAVIGCWCDMTPAAINTPAPAAAPPAVAQPVERPEATDALFRGASWLCEGCGYSDTEPYVHCGRDLTPVWVTLTRRGVDGG